MTEIVDQREKRLHVVRRNDDESVFEVKAEGLFPLRHGGSRGRGDAYQFTLRYVFLSPEAEVNRIFSRADRRTRTGEADRPLGILT